MVWIVDGTLNSDKNGEYLYSSISSDIDLFPTLR